ncbi:MAG: MexH family multidrug efflux RND transporter periplasmic adaptor subunit [Chitinophagales bacterium]|nr:MAG: MexH family multidrug efflux RND transporter periplasmic adaptor subunit [Chitinophagales bacterium]
MKNMLLAILLGCHLWGCTQDNSLEAKKEKLNQLKKQHEEIGFQIRELEQELKTLDPEGMETAKSGRLVTLLTAGKKNFEKYIDIQGTAESEKNITVSAETGGEIVALQVSEGQQVKKGQLLLQIDDALLRKEIEDLSLSLDLATTVFKRQENLWKQNIGSELQYLEAKNKKESLEAKLQKLQTQISKTRITAPVDGTVENIRVKAGETVSPGMPLMNVVNLEEIVVKADVPERYIGSVKKGEAVSIYFPALDITREASITATGSIIHPTNRTFSVEMKIPNKDHTLKANLLAIVKIIEYKNPEAITLPTRLIQRSNGDYFIFIAESSAQDMIAKRRVIKTGATYGGETEILEGLAVGETVIDEGAHDVSDGVLLEVQKSE